MGDNWGNEFCNEVQKRKKTDFCKACGASFPHRPGEGRCQMCMPRAFREMEKHATELEAKLNKLEEFVDYIATWNSTVKRMWKTYQDGGEDV